MNKQYVFSVSSQDLSLLVDQLVLLKVAWMPMSLRRLIN
jgi:hypothetical protein